MAEVADTEHMAPTNQENTMSRLDPAVVIRAARGSDGSALEQLARLDSRRPLTGEVLLAERDGEIVAAYAPATRAAIADPFRPTADVVALLELHGRRPEPRRRLRRLSVLPHMRTA
jgi:hypothetical protein